MTLRRQALTITGAVLAMLIVVLCVLSYVLLERTFRSLELDHIQHNMNRARNAMADNVSQLTSTTKDWAWWDDTYEYARGRKPDFIERNLDPQSMQNIRIGLVVCADTTGAVLVAKRYDPDKGGELPVPEGLLASGGEIDRLLRMALPTEGTSGVVRAGDVPLLFAALPVLTSARQGPVAGTLLMARFITSNETARLATVTRLAIDVSAPTPDGKAKAVAMAGAPPMHVDLSDNKLAVAYHMVHDIHDVPAFALRVRMPRGIHDKGTKMLGAFSMLLLGLGIVFCGVIAVLMEKRVLAPLAALAHDVMSISTKHEMGARLAVAHDDEIADVAARINTMLDTLERRLQYKEVVGSISTELSRIATADTDAAVERVLGEVGAFAHADRACVFLYHAGVSVADNTHEWCAREVMPEKMHLKGVRVDQELPWFAERLRKHEFVRVPDVAALPAEAAREKAHWSMQGIRSLIVAPMFVGREIAGFIGFDAVAKMRVWADDEHSLLKFAGEAIMHALARRQAENELRASEEKHSTYVNHAPHGILIVDDDGMVVDANPAVCHMTGYTKCELLGAPASRLVSPNGTARERSMVAALRTLGTAKAEMLVRKKNGEDIYMAVDAVALSANRLMWFCLDITERKRGDEELRRVSTFRESIIESAAEGICACHETKDFPFIHFTVWNRMMIEMTGYTADEINVLGWYQSMYTDPDMQARAMARMSRIRHGDNMNNEEWEITRKDGQRRHVLISTRLLPGGETGTNVLAMMDDISEQRQAEEERSRLQNQLLQVQKMESVGRLAGGVAHDFNNMLGVIIGHAELAMLENAVEKPVLHHLKQIQDVAQRSADLTRQLLAFARKQTIAPMVLDVNETVADMLVMLHRLIGEQIKLVWRPGQSVWNIKIDPTQIHQILANLTVNARDAINGIGTLTISTSNATLDAGALRVHPGFPPGAYVQLVVSDTGCGMDATVIERIFEPFFTTKDIGHGTGLGLATVYGIVKQNGGFVDVYSQPGLGSTFTIYLPRHEGDIAVPPVQDARKKMLRGKGETILVVEDSAAILDMGKAMLESMGYKVLAAGTPLDAIDLVKEYTGSIDLLLTDVVMPEMNGRDLSRHLREMKPGLKCLFMSGYTADIIGSQGVLEEGVLFIQKPFSIKQLAAGVHSAIEAV